MLLYGKQNLVKDGYKGTRRRGEEDSKDEAQSSKL